VQCDVRDALVPLKAATAQAEEACWYRAREGQWGREGRKPSYSRKQYESAQVILGKSANVGEVARSIRANRFAASKMIRPALRRRLQPAACDGNRRVAVQHHARELNPVHEIAAGLNARGVSTRAVGDGMQSQYPSTGRP
jgi:hypothetical protein